jgi:poly(3-hydroxybutyrate) depolymerase
VSIAPCLKAFDVGTQMVRCGAIDQVYLYYSPDRNATLPVVLLLHGAGDRAANMMDAWKKFAHKQKISVIAPELPRDPKFEDVAPHIFRCVVEDAKKLVGIDPQHVYLFGNSMGGYLAYDGAMFESKYFAAIAVHAMRIADEYEWIRSRAEEDS